MKRIFLLKNVVGLLGLVVASVMLFNGTAQAVDCSVLLKDIQKERRLIKKRDLLKGAVEQCRNDPEINYMYGYALERLRDYDEALKYYRTAHELNPKSAKYLFGMGDVYLQQDEAESAAAAYEKGLKINPKNKRAANSLKTARSKLPQPSAVAKVQQPADVDAAPVVVEKTVSPPIIKETKKEPVTKDSVKTDSKKHLQVVQEKPVVEKKKQVIKAEKKKSEVRPVKQGPSKPVAGDEPKQIEQEKTAVKAPQKTVPKPIIREPSRSNNVAGQLVLEIEPTFKTSEFKTLTQDINDEPIVSFKKALDSMKIVKRRLDLGKISVDADQSKLDKFIQTRQRELEENSKYDALDFNLNRETVGYFGNERPTAKE